MGGTQAKPLSTEVFAFLLQYPSSTQWEGVQTTIKTLKACFPNASVSSYRCGEGGVELFAGRGKGKERRRVYAAGELREGGEREMMQVVKEALQL